MILGTPGSGKTTTIVALVKILAKMKQRVLLCNFTNQAIDNVLIRLKDSGFTNFIRITSNPASVDPLLKDQVKSYGMFDSMEQLKQTFDSTYVFGATCLQMNNNLLLCVNGGKFDYCVMDEASQINEPLALGPILISDKFVMIGDFYQLNPLVKSPIAEKKGLNISLFESLSRKYPEKVNILKKQYRMNKDILELTNPIVYNGAMTTGNQKVSDQKVEFKTNFK